MHCTENRLIARHHQAAPTRAGKLTKLLSVFILAVIFGSMPIPPHAFGQIIHEESQTGGSSGLTTVSSASLTGVNGNLYLAAISTRPKKVVQSVTGLGLNWVLVKSICSGNNSSTSMEVWTAQGTPSGNGAVTATFASAPSTAVIAVSRYSGMAAANPIGNVIGGNTNGLNGACSGGVDGASYSFNLATTVNDAVVYGAVALKAKTHTAGAGYTERVEFQHPHAVNPIGVAVEDKSVASAATIAVDGSFSGNVDWALVALEIKPQVQYTLTVNTVGSGSVSLNPPGGTYDTGTIVTLTATPEAGFQFNGWSGDLSGSLNPTTITMDGNKNVTATFTEIPAGGSIVYEESQTGGSSASTVVTTAANLTGVNGNLYLAAISSRPKKLVQSVTGLGLNWILVKSICAGQSTTGMDVWMAQGTPSGDGAVTATLASAPSTAAIAVSRYSGVAAANPVGNVIGGNTNGLNGACAGGVDGTAYSFNLTTTVNDAVVYGAAALKAKTHTPGAGYIEQLEFQHPHAVNTIGVAVEDKNVASASNVTVNGFFNGTLDWALVALEIRPQDAAPVQHSLTVNTVGSGSVSLNPPGGTYDAGTLVTLTATPDAGFALNGWSGDLSGSTNPETITMNGDKNVTATFTEIFSGGSIVNEQNVIGGSSGSTTVTSASLTGSSGHLYLAAISSRPKKLVQSVTGLGLNWVLVKAICSGNNNTTGMEVWAAQGTPSGNGAVTATFVSVPSTAVIAVSRYSGVVPPGGGTNPIGNVIGGNTNGLDGACSGGVDGNSYSFNLATTVDEAVVYGAVALKARTHTPGAGYIEQIEFQHPHAVNPIGVAVEDKSVASASTVTVNGSLNGTVDWAVVALEIKPQPPQHTLTVNTVGSGSVELNPPGGTYDDGTLVTLTATPAAGFQFSGWSGDLSGSTNPDTITMDGDKNVTATFTAIPIAHEESQTGGSTGSTTVATAASLTGVSGHLYLAAISSKPQVNVTTVSGLGLSWQRVKAQCAGRSQTGIEVWMALGTPSGDDAVTATLATTPNTAVIAVSRYSGAATAANPIGNVVFGNTNGANGSCSNGMDNNFYSLNLLTTESGSVVYGAVAIRSRTHTPGAGYTERAESNQGGTTTLASTVAIEDKTVSSPSTVAITGSLSGSVDWALIALEIRSQGSGTAQFALTTYTLGAGSVDLNPAGGIYDDGTEVTLTANPATGFQFSGWNGDLTGLANPAIITMDASKHVTAIFTPIALGEAITHEEIRTGGASDSNLVKTSASLIGVSGQLYLAAISTKPKAVVSALSGLGLKWELVKAQCSGQNLTGVEVWMAQGTPHLNGTVTAKLASSPDNSVISVSRYSGVHAVDPVGNVTSGNTAGVAAACSLGTNNNAYSFDITTTVSGAVVYGAATMRMRTHTPGVGYTERVDIRQGSAGGSMASIAVEDTTVASASTLAVNGSFNNTVDWAVVGVEIIPYPQQFTLTVNMVGSGSVTFTPPGGTYNAGTVVTLEAAPALGFLFSGWSGDLIGSTNPTTITMDGHKNVTATFTVNTGVVYQETQTGGSTGFDTVATSASLTGVNGHLYLAAISTRPKVAVDTVTGLGLNWTLAKAQCSGRNNLSGLEVWMAQGTPSGNEPVTATLASVSLNAAIAVSRYSGVAAVNSVGNIVSGNTNGADGACANGVDNNLYSFNLTTTVDGAVAYGAATMRSRAHTPGAGYTERVEVKQGTGGNITSVAVQDKNVASAATITVDGSFSHEVDWAVVALEIKPEASVGKHSAAAGNDKLAALPSAFQLEQNYPNPFNPSTMISFALPLKGKVVVKIYSNTGQLVRTLVDGEMAVGRYTVRWNGRNQLGNTVAAGIYLYQIVVQGVDGSAAFTQTRRMAFVK